MDVGSVRGSRESTGSEAPFPPVDAMPPSQQGSMHSGLIFLPSPDGDGGSSCLKGWCTAAPERTTRQLMRGTSDEFRQISLGGPWTVHRLSGQVYLARDGSTALRNPLWAVNESCRRKLSLAYAREA